MTDGEGINKTNKNMLKKYSQLIAEDYIFCYPQKWKVDMGMIGSYQCALKVYNNTIHLKTIPAVLFLAKGWQAVDDNGYLITLLDSDIDKKLVVIEDLNLYFAIRNSQEMDKLWIEVLNKMPKEKNCRLYF